MVCRSAYPPANGRVPEHRRGVRTGQELAHSLFRSARPPIGGRDGRIGSGSVRTERARIGARDCVSWRTTRGYVSLADQTLGIGLTKACIRRAALLITTDSGPRHFAAAFQTPVITLFGPTHVAWTRTHHPLAWHLFYPVELRAVSKAGLSRGPSSLYARLTPESVLTVAQRVLVTSGRKVHADHQSG